MNHAGNYIGSHSVINKGGKMKEKETQELLLDLSWEWDRVSSSGKETLNKLFKIFNIEEMEAKWVKYGELKKQTYQLF